MANVSIVAGSVSETSLTLKITNVTESGWYKIEINSIIDTLDLSTPEAGLKVFGLYESVTIGPTPETAPSNQAMAKGITSAMGNNFFSNHCSFEVDYQRIENAKLEPNDPKSPGELMYSFNVTGKGFTDKKGDLKVRFSILKTIEPVEPNKKCNNVIAIHFRLTENCLTELQQLYAVGGQCIHYSYLGPILIRRESVKIIACNGDKYHFEGILSTVLDSFEATSINMIYIDTISNDTRTLLSVDADIKSNTVISKMISIGPSIYPREIEANSIPVKIVAIINCVGKGDEYGRVIPLLNATLIRDATCDSIKIHSIEAESKNIHPNNSMPAIGSTSRSYILKGENLSYITSLKLKMGEHTHTGIYIKNKTNTSMKINISPVGSNDRAGIYKLLFDADLIVGVTCTDQDSGLTFQFIPDAECCLELIGGIHTDFTMTRDKIEISVKFNTRMPVKKDEGGFDICQNCPAGVRMVVDAGAGLTGHIYDGIISPEDNEYNGTISITDKNHLYAIGCLDKKFVNLYLYSTNRDCCSEPGSGAEKDKLLATARVGLSGYRAFDRACASASVKTDLGFFDFDKLPTTVIITKHEDGDPPNELQVTRFIKCGSRRSPITRWVDRTSSSNISLSFNASEWRLLKPSDFPVACKLQCYISVWDISNNCDPCGKGPKCIVYEHHICDIE